MASTTSSQEKPAIVCVFCGSAAGTNPNHLNAARSLAHEFHKTGTHLVYGGGTAGLMGELARTLVSLSGPQAVHGVIPRALIRIEEGYDNSREEKDQERADKEHGHVHPRPANPRTSTGKVPERTIADPLDSASMIRESDFGTTTIVPDMHTRKRLMATKVLEGGKGSGFVSLAGGFGTMEEVMEMTTWNQLGIHRVGVVLLNVNGYWDGVMQWVRKAVQEGFISEQNGSILVEAKTVEEVLPKLRDYKVSEGRMELNWGEE